MTQMLCSEFAAMGHEVRLATQTPRGGDETLWSFDVVRGPTLKTMLRLVRWCDVHVQANVSLRYLFLALLRRHGTIYQHHSAYQKDDGALSRRDRGKRIVAKHSTGIANSQYTARNIGCHHVVLNAYDADIFTNTIPFDDRERDLVFVGRLVSQKGCDVLLRSLGRLRTVGLRPSLTVIGDGPDREFLMKMASTEGVSGQVSFRGMLSGASLAEELNNHQVIVVPSRYEEPFGIVALEGLACGCVPIVSERGGLTESVGGYGYTVPNGDAEALANVISTVIRNPSEAGRRIDGSAEYLSSRTARAVASEYLSIFESVVGT